MEQSIYETDIKRISKTLTRDFHLQQDLAQEMRLCLVRIDRYYDKERSWGVCKLMRWRAIDFRRKFIKGQIPYGSATDIENTLYQLKQDSKKLNDAAAPIF